MLVSSDFLGYLSRKREQEKNSSPLVQAALKSSPGGKDKSPPVDQVTGNRDRAQLNGEVDYLNERPSTVNVVL
ncbi:MAG: hypothetical protein LBP92_11685 [Deltaproteobacteria bacterium]|jgi:hypothetical protein|nr:hypothetical protein [Deltaproteobacteria bacterium]